MRFAGACVVATVLSLSACTKPPSPNDFNIVLITLDTTRADRIGAFGGTAVPTPNLDAAAREGVKFDAAISQVPLTLPSHASILTGRYPASHGVRHNGLYKLPDTEITLAERLRDAGFRTAAFIGAYVLNEHYGTHQGFETYDDIPTERYEGGRDNLYEAQRTAEQVNAQVFDWLGRRPEGRFFVWIHYYDPHLPYTPPNRPGLAGQGYDREISYVDACFGDLVQRLRQQKLLERSVLVVVGDHGESLGEHRELSHGVFLYEGAVRVPLMLRAPGLLPAGKTVSGPVELVDIAPTLLELLELPAFEMAQGTSLLPRIRKRAAEITALAYAETFMPRIEFGWSELRMVRDDRFKYVQAPRPELYDLSQDPTEQSNLIDQFPERAREMSDMIDAWVARTASNGSGEQAERTLTEEEEARLRSLGYLGGGRFGTTGDGAELPDPKDRIEEGRLLTQARDRMAAGQVEQALQTIDEMVRLNPRNHLARTSRVQALVRLQRLSEAEQEARAAVETSIEDAAAWAVLEEQARRALASVLWMAGKNQEAEREYRLAIELNQRNRSAPVFGGLLLGAAGGREEAMRIVEQVLQRNPRDGMALAARFELELASGEQQAAHRTAQQLAELRAGDANTLIKAGKLVRDAGDAKLAAVLFEVADERQKDDPDILGYLGTARLAAGDIAGAERALLAARRLRPNDPRAPFYLGNIALLRSDERKARGLFAEALQLDPDFTPPLLNLARWLAEKRRFAEAAEAVREALERRPGDPEAKRLLDELQASISASGTVPGGAQ